MASQVQANSGYFLLVWYFSFYIRDLFCWNIQAIKRKFVRSGYEGIEPLLLWLFEIKIILLDQIHRFDFLSALKIRL